LTKVQDITSPMTLSEKKATWSLASIYALRMLGLFLIMPVLSLFAEQLEGSTPSLIGMAIGVYGITQALLQIPFGLMSDRYGRKKIIIIGLILFFIGSIVAAVSTSIYGVLLGRAIQGSGAIAAFKIEVEYVSWVWS
jgi:MFS family permease